MVSGKPPTHPSHKSKYKPKGGVGGPENTTGKNYLRSSKFEPEVTDVFYFGREVSLLP